MLHAKGPLSRVFSYVYPQPPVPGETYENNISRKCAGRAEQAQGGKSYEVKRTFPPLLCQSCCAAAPQHGHSRSVSVLDAVLM